MGSTTALQEIPVGKLDPSPFQTRQFPKSDPELQELADSIATHEVVEPIIVRKKGKRFEVVAGERRLRASKLAKKKTIPAVVREYDDDQAMQITCIENLQRKDLHPLHEGAAISMLCDRAGWTLETVSEQIGRPVSYVARRARLKKLSKKWQKVLIDPQHPAARWSASHMDAVACLEPADQDSLLASLNQHQFMASAATLRDIVERGYLLRIHSAPWKPGDAELLPKAGACTACPMRASANPGLFDDVGSGGSVPKNDRCLSRTCWDEKMGAFKARALEAAQSEHGKTIPVLVRHRHGQQLGRHEVNGWDYAVSRGPKPGFRPALELRADEPNFGGVVYAKSHYAKEPVPGNREAAEKTAAERLQLGQERLGRRRMRRCIEITYDRVKDTKPPAIAALLAMATLLGTYRRKDGTYGDVTRPCNADALPENLRRRTAWSLIGNLDAGVNKALREHLWRGQLLPLFASRWKYGGTFTPVDAQWRECQSLCELLGIDANAIATEVEAELPEPKSWTKLREQVRLEKAEARKAKKRGKEAAAA